MQGFWVIVLKAIVLTACATVTAWKACHYNCNCRNSFGACSTKVPHLHDFYWYGQSLPMGGLLCQRVPSYSTSTMPVKPRCQHCESADAIPGSTGLHTLHPSLLAMHSNRVSQTGRASTRYQSCQQATMPMSVRCPCAPTGQEAAGAWLALYACNLD